VEYITEHLNTPPVVPESEEGNDGRSTVEYKGSMKRTDAIQVFGLESDFDIRTNVFFAGHFHFSSHAGRLYDAVDDGKAQARSSLQRVLLGEGMEEMILNFA